MREERGKWKKDADEERLRRRDDENGRRTKARIAGGRKEGRRKAGVG